VHVSERHRILVAELVAAAPRPVALGLLAERLGVAPGTVERDVGTLRRSGVPIRTAPGRGYALARGSVAQPGSGIVQPRAEEAESTHELGPSDGAKVLLFRQRDEVVDREVWCTVERAVRERRVAVLHYADREGVTSVREVEPAGLLRGLDAWYLAGFCRLRGAGRAFRLDRIQAARLTGEQVPAHGIRDVVADVPAGFGHATADG
jgi:proteasome accessory factor B